MIEKNRKIYLINCARRILTGLPEEMAKEGSLIRGNRSFAQVVLNRVMEVTRKEDEAKYMVDTISELIRETDKKEVRIVDSKGKEVSEVDFKIATQTEIAQEGFRKKVVEQEKKRREENANNGS